MSALYSYGVWFVVMVGWALLVSVVIVVEVTRGGRLVEVGLGVVK